MSNIILQTGGDAHSMWQDIFGSKGFELNSKDIYGISELRELVFANKNLTDAVIPAAVRTIGKKAFKGCDNLASVTIPNTVDLIKEDAFDGCNNLATIHFRGVQEEWDAVTKESNWNGGRYINVICLEPSQLYYDGSAVSGIMTIPSDGVLVIPPTYNGTTITTIESDALGYGDQIKEIIFPKTLTQLKNALFINYQGQRSAITSAEIPNNVTEMAYTFCGCKKLKTVYIPPSITKFGHQTFDYCTALDGIYISDLAAWCNIVFEPTVGSSPLEFAHKLYLNGIELTDLEIPSSVERIATEAFANCYSIKNVVIPNTYSWESITGLGAAFSNCKNIESIRVDGASQDYYSSGNCIISTNMDAGSVCCGCKNSTIPTNQDVFYIGYGAFAGDRGEFSLSIPSNITQISSHAFYNCIGLQSITFPNTNIDIYDSAFYGCVGLTSLTLPANVTLHDVPFNGCTSLQSIDGGFENTARAANQSHGSNITITVTEENGTVGAYLYGGVPVTTLYWPRNISYIDSYIFNGNNTLDSLFYAGTISDFEAISKDPEWYLGGVFHTVHCTDGDIEY